MGDNASDVDLCLVIDAHTVPSGAVDETAADFDTGQCDAAALNDDDVDSASEPDSVTGRPKANKPDTEQGLSFEGRIVEHMHRILASTESECTLLSAVYTGAPNIRHVSVLI